MSIHLYHEKNHVEKNIKWPSSTMVKMHANEVLSFHNIPYIVCTIYQLAPIPIITQLHAANYYNKKRFHSIILQGIIVANQCIFWDFDTKWVSSMHDANMWAHTTILINCDARRFTSYVLVGDATYPCHPWMFLPFKGR
jgi:hypothetical protein